jgi:DNA-binding response OmpR family regulator
MARVLVVDDDPDLLTLVRIQLRHHGHDVLTAPSGKDALDLVGIEGLPDVAILDVSMPGMSGLELLTKLRSMDGFEALPAIFLSARTTPDDIQAGTSLGAQYLTKPYVMGQLLQAIASSLAG